MYKYDLLWAIWSPRVRVPILRLLQTRIRVPTETNFGILGTVISATSPILPSQCSLAPPSPTRCPQTCQAVRQSSPKEIRQLFSKPRGQRAKNRLKSQNLEPNTQTLRNRPRTLCFLNLSGRSCAGWSVRSPTKRAFGPHQATAVGVNQCLEHVQVSR